MSDLLTVKVMYILILSTHFQPCNCDLLPGRINNVWWTKASKWPMFIQQKVWEKIPTVIYIWCIAIGLISYQSSLTTPPPVLCTFMHSSVVTWRFQKIQLAAFPISVTHIDHRFGQRIAGRAASYIKLASQLQQLLKLRGMFARTHVSDSKRCPAVV